MGKIIFFLSIIYSIIVVYFVFHFHETQFHNWSYCIGEALVWPVHVFPIVGEIVRDIVGGIILIIFILFLFFRIF